MTEAPSDTRLCVGDLGNIALAIARRAGIRVPDGTVAIHSVRLKPRRSLTVSFGARAPRTTRPQLTVTVGAHQVKGAHLTFDRRQAELASVTTVSPGILVAPELDLAVQVFPADASLPALAACLDTSPEGPVFSCLRDVARLWLGDHRWALAAATAEPMRYKPGSRCVLVYHLQGTDGRRLDVIGKLYADPAQARGLHANLTHLHTQLGCRATIIPRPLGVAGDLGLAWAEAVPHHRKPPISRSAPLSDTAVAWAGMALATLHAARLPAVADWEAGKEAEQAHERGSRLAAWQPDQGAVISRLAERLAGRLEKLPAEERVVSHGAYKRSQLILEGDRKAVIDFDGLCVADPGLDVGCFLAYLRPAGIFRGRRDCAEWFEAAGAGFARSYGTAARAQGRTPGAVEQTLEHARLFEASRLLKIATRRINRLNSPRPSELSGIYGQVTECLDNPTRWSCAR
jgi:hypothetical protein